MAVAGAEATLQRPPDMPPPAGDQEGALADYLTRRFLAIYHHPFWEKFRRQATEDHEFRTGTGQWEKGQKGRLTGKGKPALTINQIRPVIEIIKGYEADAPLEGKPVPMGEEDLENVLVFERLSKHAAKRAQTEHECSDGFDEGITGGLAWWYVGVDYTEDFIYGTPILRKLPWADVVYDPGSRDYDLRDVREIFWLKRVAVDDLKAQYPTKAEEIDAAVTVLPSAAQEGVDGFLLSGLELPARDPRDGYTTPLLGGLQLYDALAHEILVVEGWYRVWQWEDVLIDTRLDTITVLPPEVVPLARELARLDPEVRVIQKPRREFRMGVFLPATKTWLAGGHPHENDLAMHPFVQFIAYREGDEILGSVRNLKDSQREVNKRRSAFAALAASQRYKYLVHRPSLENPQALEDDTESVFYASNPNLGGFRELPPIPIPQYFLHADQIAKEEIRETSLVNAPMQGQATGQSGIALAHLKQQGQIGTASLFRNYRRSRYLLTHRWLKRVQQCYSSEKTLRLDVGAGETAWVTINQRHVTPEGTLQVVRDIPSLKWDVEVVDSPLTPTARMAHLVMLLEVISKLPPDYAEALADILIEWTDIPNRDETVRRIRAIQARKGLGEMAPAIPGGPPSGGNGVARPGVTPGLVNRIMAGAPPIAEQPMRQPLADNLRAAGMVAGGGALI